MAETLLAILLVTSSAKGSSLVYRWPPSPASSIRLSRPKPTHAAGLSQLDNPWRAANLPELQSDTSAKIATTPWTSEAASEDDEDYEWKRPSRDRSMSFSHSPPHRSSSRSSPSKDGDSYDIDHIEDSPVKDEYDDLLGYSSEFLAGLLCPQRSLCHQKFELIVDDLVFVGHPVCAEVDGLWQFKPEKRKSSTRGRGSRNRKLSQVDEADVPTPDGSTSAERRPQTESAWLQTFHFVIVMDRPDPSSSASGNVSKYFDIIYEQIAFTVAAVLFQEQVLSNFVETECDLLGALKDDCTAKGEKFSNYMTQALQVSSIAPAMKALYEALKTSSMAYITIHDLPLELQLPPYLDALLHSEDDNEMDCPVDEEEVNVWGRELSFGWMLPALTPWKSLLLLDGDDEGVDPYTNLRGPHVNPEDTTLAEGLIRFLEHASVTLSLAEMASLLDWDLESQIYPTVRWLVHHRRAKVVDSVHQGLKTVFTLPPKFEKPLSQLSAEFEREFSHPSIPTLPEILSLVSISTSKQTDNHFFAAVVQSKDLIDLYHDVVIWMLKRDLLVTLHLRVRVVASAELKLQVRMARERAKAAKARNAAGSSGRGRRQEVLDVDRSPEIPVPGMAWLSLSPKSARRHSRRLPSADSGGSRTSDLTGSAIMEDEFDEDADEEEEEEEEEGEDVDWDDDDDDNGHEEDVWPSMICDPGRATPLERRWLSAMSEGKEEYLARRFEQINQYFDGRRTDDEILFRADITRKQLREVLHHYEEYLQTFLHPS